MDLLVCQTLTATTAAMELLRTKDINVEGNAWKPEQSVSGVRIATCAVKGTPIGTRRETIHVVMNLAWKMARIVTPEVPVPRAVMGPGAIMAKHVGETVFQMEKIATSFLRVQLVAVEVLTGMRMSLP